MDKSIENQVKRWVEFAKEEVYSTTCFHCQQAAEKLFKAILLKEKGIVPKTHSLEKLRLELGKLDSSWRDLKEETRFLDQFYVSVRYPDAFPGALPEGLPNKKDAQKALEIAERILVLSKKVLS